MTTTIRKAALIMAVTGFVNCLSAQKVAHLSFDSLVSLMPETKVATEAAQAYFKGLEQEIVAMQGELETKYKTYLESEATMSDLLKKNKQDDMQQLQTRISEFQRQAEADYRRKQAELTMPIFEKAKKGIEAVAKEGGYKYVLDTSVQSGSVLYSEPADDILMLVKKKLDTMPQAVIPGTRQDAPPKSPPSPGGGKAQPKK